MCLGKSRLKKETIKSIRRMNRVLNTHFSYVNCIEETDFLNRIPKEFKNTNEYRLEHLSNILGLWHKGIVEDYFAHNKQGENFEKIKPLFESFLANYIYELSKMKVLENYDSKFDYSVSKKNYTINFSEYDYAIKNERMEDITAMIDVLDKFKKVAYNKVNVDNDEYLSKFVKFNYYGPMTRIYGYNKIKKNVKDYGRYANSNPFNNMLDANRLGRFKRLINKCDRKFLRNKTKYLGFMLDMEKSRLEFELNRLYSNDTRYDFYFDYYLYRLYFDLDYLFFKQLGGIKKVSELINIHDKSKKYLEKEAIVVDVDRIEYIEKSSKKDELSSKKEKTLDIKSFDDILKQERFRKEQREIRNEGVELRRK